MIRNEAWPFYRTSSGVRICWVLEEPKGPKGGSPGGFFGRLVRNLEGLVWIDSTVGLEGCLGGLILMGCLELLV